VVVLAFLTPPVMPIFNRLAPLLEGTPFAGLRCDRVYHGYVRQMFTHVTPRIEGRRTLWLWRYGPHSAFGGRPVLNVAVYCPDTYHSRIEDSLFAAWENVPPEYVVLGDFGRARGAKRLSEAAVQAWLEDHYVKVWQGMTVPREFSRLQGISLWQSNYAVSTAEQKRADRWR